MRAFLLLLLVCTVYAEDPSGGAVIGPRPVPRQDTPKPVLCKDRNGKELPWPEPDKKDVDALLTELKGQLDNTFTYSVIGPWVVACNMEPDDVKRFVDGTMATYGSVIQKQLFTKTPRSEPVKVYLFKDAETYTSWNLALWRERPTTPYGYYSRAKRALVMNIGTGGGTLLHEMVHAIAEADFADIPSWLNEGLGSLFEASNVVDKRVVGVKNWRLRGLLKDLADKREIHYKDLLKTTTHEFYGERSGSNYASIRYLMQYLQDHGKLENFYWRVRDQKDADALASLRAVFDNKLSVDEIETKVYTWAKGLGTP